MTDLIEVVSLAIDALERTGVPYTVGGSLASSFSGEPRSSIDADILVDMRARHVAPFLEAVGDQFYADADALHRAIATGTNTNLIHHASGVKIDLFIPRSVLDARQLERRRRVRIASEPERYWYVHSPEDILLQKLVWYREGGHVSDRQWRDVVAIVTVQRGRLDRPYLAAMAATSGVTDLLERVTREAGRSPDDEP